MSEPRDDAPGGDGGRGHERQLAGAPAAATGQRAAQAPVTAPGKAVMITFPPAIDCELGRFLLAHYRIPYEERRHVVIFSFFATLWRGATLLVPLLYGDSYPTLDTVRKMIDYFDPLCPADRNLLLAGPSRDNVEADWKAFNGTLSRAAAAFAYFHLDARLADGRQYLVGDRFSLSDMAFANALAPLALPDVYARLLPSFAEMPPALRSVIAEIRSRPCWPIRAPHLS
jgi:glutathione S-transferase